MSSFFPKPAKRRGQAGRETGGGGGSEGRASRPTKGSDGKRDEGGSRSGWSGRDGRPAGGGATGRQRQKRRQEPDTRMEPDARARSDDRGQIGRFSRAQRPPHASDRREPDMGSAPDAPGIHGIHDTHDRLGSPGSIDNSMDAPLLPGVKPVMELLESSPERVDAVFLRKGRHGKEMERIADLCRAAGIRFSLLEQSVFSRLYSGSSQGVVARLFEAGYVELEDMLAGIMDAPVPLLLAFDQIQDTGNAGTLARTLYALGGAGIITTKHNGAYLGSAAARASAGALEKLPVCKVANLGQALDKVRKQGIAVYGAVGKNASPDAADAGKEYLDVFAFTPLLPAVLVLGNEESGMRQGMEKRCDYFLDIPMMRDFDSLNVAQAGAIIIAAFARAVRMK